MFTVFLAFVIFAELGETPPKIVGAYKSLEECWSDAGAKNRNPTGLQPVYGRGYVCLEMRSEV